MLVTLLGMVTLANLLQSENAQYPMLVTLSGMVILVKSMQPENAASPMLVTLPSSGITLFLQPDISVLLTVSIKHFPALWYTELPCSTIMLVKPLQQENALSPMLVTLSGMVILVKLLQS